MIRATRPDDGVRWPPVRRHLRAAQRTHSGRTATAIASTIYEVLLIGAILGGVVYGFVGDTFGHLAAPSPTASGPLALATAVAAAATLFLAARAVGPLVAGPARAAWLLPSPLDRAGLLAGPTAAALATCAVGGSAGALAVAALAGWGLDPVVLIAGALAGLATGELALIVQTRPAVVSARASLIARALLTVAVVAAAAVAVAPGTVSDEVPVPPATSLVLGAIAALGAVCLVLVVPASRAPRHAGLPELTSGAPLLAAFWSAHLERGLLTDIAQGRRLRRRGAVRSRRFPGRRFTAMVAAAFLAVGRNRSAAGRIALGALVPHIAALIVPPILVPTVQLGGVTLAAFAAGSTLSVIARSPALRRALGGSDRALLAGHTAPPAVTAVLVTALVAPVGGTVLSTTLLPIAALAVVLREVTRPEPALTATLLDTPIGTLPVEQIRDRLRGGAGTFAIAVVVLTSVS